MRKQCKTGVLVVSPQYPTKTDPAYSFVEQLVNAISLLGVDVMVIAPQSIVRHFLRKTELHPRFRKRLNENGASVEVFQPYTISFGGHFERLNDSLERLAIKRTIKKISTIPSFFYGHFWHSAYKLYPIAKSLEMPLFVATGESRITITDVYSLKQLRPFLEYVKGVVCVSTKNKEESISLGLVSSRKCIVLPNAIDDSLFHPLDRKTLRTKHQIPIDAFIIVFVGAFIHRKGPDRVATAISSITDGRTVYSFFIGAPHENENSQPICENILFKGRLPHSLLPEYLSMANAFVLPTLEEGCCNAIIEAMACGLPIVSSDRSFNYDVLDSSNSFLVDPMDVMAIKESILKLRDNNELCKEMGLASLEKAASLTIAERARRIIDYMKSNV